MAQATHLTRDEEIQKIHKRYADFYKIGSGLILVLIGIWIGSLLFSDGYATNVYTEILSVIATIVVLDQINQWRDTQRLQKRLLREISGQSNIRAKDAIDWMGHEKWLTTKDNIHLLKETNLREAKLQGARLDYANLQNTNLQNAKLQGANLEGAYLQGANLRRLNYKIPD